MNVVVCFSETWEGGGIVRSRWFWKIVGGIIWGFFLFLYVLFELVLGFIFLLVLWFYKVTGGLSLKRGKSVPENMVLGEDNPDRKRAETGYAILYNKITELEQGLAPEEEFLDLLDMCQRVDSLYRETHPREHFFALESRIWGIVRTLRKNQEEAGFNP